MDRVSHAERKKAEEGLSCFCRDITAIKVHLDLKYYAKHRDGPAEAEPTILNKQHDDGAANEQRFADKPQPDLNSDQLKQAVPVPPSANVTTAFEVCLEFADPVPCLHTHRNQTTDHRHSSHPITSLGVPSTPTLSNYRALTPVQPSASKKPALTAQTAASKDLSHTKTSSEDCPHTSNSCAVQCSNTTPSSTMSGTVQP